MHLHVATMVGGRSNVERAEVERRGWEINPYPEILHEGNVRLEMVLPNCLDVISHKKKTTAYTRCTRIQVVPIPSKYLEVVGAKFRVAYRVIKPCLRKAHNVRVAGLRIASDLVFRGLD